MKAKPLDVLVSSFLGMFMPPATRPEGLRARTWLTCAVSTNPFRCGFREVYVLQSDVIRHLNIPEQLTVDPSRTCDDLKAGMISSSTTGDA